MLSREDNEMLVRTGAGTPMGNLFRAYWIPVLLSGQLPENDGAQVRVKVLGEELLAWKSLGLRGLTVKLAPDTAPRVEVKETSLADFYARLSIDETGRINDGDTRIMRITAFGLSDKEIQAVASYAAGLR